MAKATNPITLSQEFGIAEKDLSGLGVLNPTIAIDTLLFIDPMLLKQSSHGEINTTAINQYRAHFEQVIALLRGSKSHGDPAWRAAQKLLSFPEIAGTCLGYGAGSIRGSGFGSTLTARILNVAAEIIDIGIEDPDLFVAMALFESDIGPDRISDMTTNVIFEALCDFNRRILKTLNMKGEEFTYKGTTGIFLANPYEGGSIPVIMLPDDILKELPVVKDWDEIAYAASKNDALRNAVNQHIGEIWEKKTKRDKGKLKKQALASKEAFETLLDAMRGVDLTPYDTESDSKGLIRWATKGQEYARRYPLALTNKNPATLDEVFDVVNEIVENFRHLIEHQGLNKELYQTDKKARHESTAQRLFFAVAFSHCKANNVDVSPEIDVGTGKVDFKFSKGFNQRVLVEIKLSTNPKTVAGYSSQLEIYKQAQQTMRAIYLVIDVGSMGKKQERLIAERNAATQHGDPLSELEFIDGLLKPSPSKL